LKIEHRKTALIAAAIALALGLTGCSPKSSEAALRTRSSEPVDPMVIQPKPDLRQRLETGQPQMQAVQGSLRVAGRIEADETRLARVSAPVTGRIVELNAVEGQHVQRGHVLATIYSTELSIAQSAFLKAESQLQVAERAVARARLLLDADVIGKAELQRREAELVQAGADLAAAREQLGVLGLNESEIKKLESTRAVSSLSHILSTIDGIVLERSATIGQVVQAVQTVFVISDLSRVWLVADVPEQSAGNLAVGKAVAAEIPALPGEKITGQLSFVSAVVNPETRTVRTRMNLPNPKHRYKPSMLANITLMDEAERRIVVPSEAVVRESNADYVFVETTSGTFMLRKVTVGEDTGNVRVVMDGITRDDRIVTKGAFHLNNERKRVALGDSGD
jgi:cobalt-zinc-cadmium efflux system membrane fusion protein